MKWFCFALVLLIAAVVGAVEPAQTIGAVTVHKIYTPERRLELEVEVPAAVDKVWEAMSTAEGMKTWITPDAKVDLRVGGDWLAMFPGAAPGGGTIVGFTPQK